MITETTFGTSVKKREQTSSAVPGWAGTIGAIMQVKTQMAMVLVIL
jgi:hypothetical protein